MKRIPEKFIATKYTIIDGVTYVEVPYVPEIPRMKELIKVSDQNIF